MIIKEFFYEIILLGTFFTLSFYIMNKGKRKTSKRVIKPYWMMDKNELAQLELEVDNNLDLRAEVQSRFNIMIWNNQISNKSLNEIKDLIKSDIKGYKGSKKANIFINNCLRNEYISNKNLNIIKDVLNLESQSFFNSKPLARKKSEKAKVIQLDFSK